MNDSVRAALLAHQALHGPYRGAAAEPSNPITGDIEARLEEAFQLWRRMGYARPPKQQSMTLGIQLGVTSQNIGKWLTRRAKLEDGAPVQQQKTAEQLAVLEREMDADPYPQDEDAIRIAEETGLGKKQVKAWFVYQRKRRGIALDEEGNVVYDAY